MTSLLWLLLLALCSPFVAIDPTWEALDARPLPSWYDESKFGIFIHWGVFSVPAFETEWFWYVWQGGYDGPVKENFQAYVDYSEPKNFAYQDYARQFTAQLWEPDEWADIFARSGAQYVVLTSKHHEGFCNWDSRKLSPTWNWNSMDVGPRRDLVGDLAKAVKNTTSDFTQQKLHFGLYHSLIDWYNPMYIQDMHNNFATNQFAREKSIPELYDLVQKYEPEIIWSDGWGGGNSDYWNVTEFLAWYATNSTVNQTATWNDRWGRDTLCKHGTFRTCADSWRPTNITPFKFENCHMIDRTSWGYNRMARYEAYDTTENLIHLLIETVAFNGNLLLNIGPRADGTIPAIFVDRLVGIGEWLKVNGEAIYKTRPWSVCEHEAEPDVFYTTRNDTKTNQTILYAHIREWPEDDKLHLACPKATKDTQARMLGFSEDLTWSLPDMLDDRSYVTGTIRTVTASRELEGIKHKAGMDLDLPRLNPSTIPCQHAWVVALTGLANV